MDLLSRIFLWFGRQAPEEFARQLSHPTGLFGRATGVYLNRAAVEMKRTAMDSLDLRPDHRVLEVGFGGGATLGALLKRVPDGVVAGVEISETMLRHARLRFRHEIAAGRMELSAGRASKIPVDDATFDRALSINTIYFWDTPLTGLKEVARVLKPGGRLVLGTGEKSAMERLPPGWHGFRTFEQGELEELMREAGYLDIRAEKHEGEFGDFLLTQGTSPGKAPVE